MTCQCPSNFGNILHILVDAIALKEQSNECSENVSVVLGSRVKSETSSYNFLAVLSLRIYSRIGPWNTILFPRKTETEVM
jgi:hypothetical protein